MNYEQEFHRKRIAFMIINDDIMFLEYNIMSHKEWYKSLNVKQDNFENIVRGYILENKVVFYKGNFEYDEEVIKAVEKYCPIIKEKYDIKNLEVGVGLIEGKNGESWKPMKKII